ncbi:fibronectin type III domain-containing protein [Patescibacteria group bacterium]|nr:fibronectin type III domain-containing protein [Patescibacteria group bacterium]
MKKYFLIVFLLTFIIGFFVVLPAQAALVGNTTQATLSLSPATGSYNANDTFQVSIYINTNGRTIDTVAAYLSYDRVHFSATSIDVTGSVFTMQAENIIDPINGKIKITRGIPYPSTVNSSNGLVARINFTALSGTTPSSDNLTFDFAPGDANQSNAFLAGVPLLSGVYNGLYTVSGGTGDTTAPTVSAFTIPSTATSLTVSISSFAATDNVGVSGYMITETATAPSASATGWSASAPTSYTFASAGSKTLYAWTKDAAGNVSTSRSASVTVTLPDNQAPSIPTSLSATAVSSSQINLSWTASTDNVGISGYRIYRSGTQIATSATNSYSNSGLSASTAYTYTVAAYDAAGNVSAQSTAASATTQASDTTPPSISAVAATSVSANSATITWTTNEAADSQVEYGLTTSYGSQTALNASLVTAHSVLLSNLSASTLYHFRVKSKDATSNLTTSVDYTLTTIAVAPTLSVTLSANPNSGTAPLSEVGLTAVVSGNITDNINYTFYCNRSDTGINITTPYQGKYDNQSQTTYSAPSTICNSTYANAGTYTAKVVVERGTYQAEARTQITVSAAVPSPSPSPTPSTNSLPVGWLDKADAGGVAGWAYDLDAGTSPIDVHVYIDGVIAGATTANLPRPDIVGAADGAVKDANHGFNYSFPVLSAGTHRINVYAINTPVDTNPELTGSPKTINVSSDIPPSPSPSPGPIGNNSLVRLIDDTKVYIIEDGQRRWIPTLDTFVANGYSWSDVQEVDSSVFNQYSEGQPLPVAIEIPSAHANAALVRLANNPRVYALIGTKLHWIPNPDVFNLYRYQWSKIKVITANQFNQYSQTRLLRAIGDTKVYYLNTKNQKKWIINEEVFASYGNKWSDVLEVLPQEIDAYQSVLLVKTVDNPKVYLLEGTTKRWVTTEQVFAQLGYKWEDVDTINLTEFNAFTEGAVIE